MKRNLNYLRGNRRERERQRVLNNFYTKQMKKGKTTRADILDKMSLGIVISLILTLLLNKLIGNFLISFVIGFIVIATIGIYIIRISLGIRNKKIEEIKNEYKTKLEEEKVLSSDENIEDYIIDRYYEKKSELKSSFNFLSKDKIFKLYLLFIIFYITAYFSTYPIYYKIMAVLSFLMATFIGSYNLTEYLRKRERQ